MGLWTRKEAVYKIYNRQSHIRSYIPLQIACLDFNSEIGTVSCYGTVYFTETEITDSFIHTIAVLDKNDLEKIIFLNPLDVFMKEGIPFYNQGKNSSKPASKSNHGVYERIISLI